MADSNFCGDEEIEWEALLDQLPSSPGICLDDLLLPLVTDDHSTDTLSSSFDGDHNGDNVAAVEHTDSFGSTLSALSDILFNDEDFEEEPPGFVDLKSSLADELFSQQQHVHVDNCFDDVDASKSEDRVPPTKRRTEEEEGGEGEVDDFSRKRKRNRESSAMSRERRKAYVKTLEAKCRVLEGRCRSLERSLTYSSLENVVLRRELTRTKEEAEKGAFLANLAHYHGGGAEPAVLLLDSLQKESLLYCLMMMWLMTMAAMVAVPKVLPPAAPLTAAVVEVITMGESRRNNVGCMEGRRRWKWLRKKMKVAACAPLSVA